MVRRWCVSTSVVDGVITLKRKWAILSILLVRGITNQKEYRKSNYQLTASRKPEKIFTFASAEESFTNIQARLSRAPWTVS